MRKSQIIKISIIQCFALLSNCWFIILGRWFKIGRYIDCYFMLFLKINYTTDLPLLWMWCYSWFLSCHHVFKWINWWFGSRLRTINNSTQLFWFLMLRIIKCCRSWKIKHTTFFSSSGNILSLKYVRWNIWLLSIKSCLCGWKEIIGKLCVNCY